MALHVRKGQERCVLGWSLSDKAASKGQQSLSSKNRRLERILAARYLLEASHCFFFFFFFSVPECCQNAINRTLGKLGAIVHTFYCPTINKNCEKQWHEKILKISYTHTRTHTQTQIKSPPWTRDTRGSFGGNLDYREKPTCVPGWLIHWSELINKLFN